LAIARSDKAPSASDWVIHSSSGLLQPAKAAILTGRQPNKKPGNRPRRSARAIPGKVRSGFPFGIA
jgi:hypothetical protein